jgi:hypothetical protein
MQAEKGSDMKPVDQTRFGFPGGNCMQAAIASILELPLAEVPDFCNRNWEGDWESDLNQWLYEHFGLFSLQVDIEKSEDLTWFSDNCICLATVRSKTGSRWIGPDGKEHEPYHSVVYHKNRIIHDPNPSRAHLTGDLVCLRAFVAVNPAEIARHRALRIAS